MYRSDLPQDKRDKARISRGERYVQRMMELSSQVTCFMANDIEVHVVLVCMLDVVVVARLGIVSI